MIEPSPMSFVVWFSTGLDSNVEQRGRFLSKPKIFTGTDEVAVKVEQSPDDTGEAPQHEAFTDEEKNVRIEQCVLCGAEYAIMFSHIYQKKRTFEELSDQLQLRLEEDHRAGRNHGPLIPLKWSESTRKRKSKKQT